MIQLRSLTLSSLLGLGFLSLSLADIIRLDTWSDVNCQNDHMVFLYGTGGIHDIQLPTQFSSMAKPDGEPAPHNNGVQVTDINGRTSPGMYGGQYYSMPVGQCYSSPSKPSAFIQFVSYPSAQNDISSTNSTNSTDVEMTTKRRQSLQERRARPRWTFRDGLRYFFQTTTGGAYYVVTSYHSWFFGQELNPTLRNAFYTQMTHAINNGEEYANIYNAQGIKKGFMSWNAVQLSLAQMNAIAVRETMRDALTALLAGRNTQVAYTLQSIEGEMYGTLTIGVTMTPH